MPVSLLSPGAFRSTNSARLLTSTRASLDDLQRQLATGSKSETYGGLGSQRFTSLDFRAKASELRSYQSTITQFNIRVGQLNLGLTRLTKIGDDLSSAALSTAYDPDTAGKTSSQKFARLNFDEAIGILNSEVNGVHLYAGRASDVQPAVDPEIILEGDLAGRAGVRQVIAERKAADFGVAPNVGRIVQGGAGTAATLTEDGVHPFGLKITAAVSTTPDITAALTAGPPANLAFNVAANPVDGDQLRFELTLPDGSKRAVQITAKAAASVPPNSSGEFVIGATPTDTATSIRATIAQALDREATTALSAASAKVAADAFFAGSTNSPPLRVSGPPATATALVAGTAANTVIWYQGDDQAANPRTTTQAKIDTGQVVGVGVQANEKGIQRVLASLAIYSTETFTGGDADKGRYQAINDKIRGNLGNVSGTQSVKSILIEIAASHTSIKGAEERHKTRLNFVESIVGDVENANQEETAAKLLSLQTKLQAAYQTTSIISRLNLTEYLR